MNDERWYSRFDVQYSICAHTRNREVALIRKPDNIALRHMTMNSPQHMQHIRRNIVYGDGWQYYHSLATYEGGIPRFPYPHNREAIAEWKATHHKRMVAYDVLIDIDAGSHRDLWAAKQSASLIIQKVARIASAIRLRFTGCGYHIIIPYEHHHGRGVLRLDPESDDSIYAWSRNYCEALRRSTSEMVDSNLNDPRRIVKIPGSISHYPAGSFVCHEYPSMEEFHALKLRDFALPIYSRRAMKAQHHIIKLAADGLPATPDRDHSSKPSAALRTQKEVIL